MSTFARGLSVAGGLLLLASGPLVACGSDSTGPTPPHGAAGNGGTAAGGEGGAGGAPDAQAGVGAAGGDDDAAAGAAGGGGTGSGGEAGAAANGSEGGSAGATTNEIATTLVIGPEGGTLRGRYGAELIVPPGAMDQELRLSLERDSGGAPPLVDTDEVGIAGSMYALLPHGTSFAKPVTVRVPFDPTQVSDPTLLRLYKAESGGSFSPIASSLDGDFLVAEIQDFSWVIVGFTAARPRVVYALSHGKSGPLVSAYPIDTMTGNLRASTSGQGVGSASASIALHPSGRFLFVANTAAAGTQNGISSDSIATFPVSLTAGTLGSLLGGVSTPLGVAGSDTRLVPHPSGKFLYAVVDQGLTGGSLVRLSIRATDGQLSAPQVVLTGPNVTPRAFAFSPAGDFAYVTSEYTPGGAGLNYRLVTYPVDSQGAFGSSLGSAAIGQDTPSAVAVHPTGQFVYATTQDGTVSEFRVSTATGLATAAGSLNLTGKPLSLAVDTQGAYLYAGRVEAYNSVNLFSFAIDAVGGLTQVGTGLAGCSQGACSMPTVVSADPQGDFVYALNGTGEMTAFGLNRATGALTQKSASTGFITRVGVARLPWQFAVAGRSPRWLNRCTTNCALLQGVPGSPTPPTPPAPTTATLRVTRGTWGGHITSSPAGINYGDGVSETQSTAEFPVGTIVSLSVTPQQLATEAYDIEWSGDCLGDSQGSSVTISKDKECRVELKRILP